MAYSGKYKIKKPEKYVGDPTKITYRSLWEKSCFKWCEANSQVIAWNSEEVVVPYRWKVDKKMHRYYVDLLIKMESGHVILVEIKPDKETKPPKQPSRQTKKYITEVTTYIKNTDKWEAARDYAEDRGWTFEIWTEHTLKAKGIKIVGAPIKNKKKSTTKKKTPVKKKSTIKKK
jgi:hypothetical protein